MVKLAGSFSGDLSAREWVDMDAAVGGVGGQPELVFGREGDVGCAAVSLSSSTGAAVVIVGAPGVVATLLVESAAGCVWLWQGCCVVAVQPEPWQVRWRELGTPVVSMRAFDALGAMAVVCEDAVLLLSPELETLRSWPTDLVAGVVWLPAGVRVSQWDDEPMDISFGSDADA